MSNDQYASPYAPRSQQYPSQSSDFLSLEIGGPGKSGESTQARQQYQSNQRPYGRYSTTPGKYNNNNSNDNRGGYQQRTPYKNRGGGGRYSATPGKYNMNESPGGFYQQRQQIRNRGGGGGQYRSHGDFDGNVSQGGFNQQNRWNNNGQRFNNGGRQQRNNKNQEFNPAAYFHPAMLVDPWKELMERHNAIRKSEINLSKEQDERLPKEETSSDAASEEADVSEG